ncbi:MAG TPA: hypothetical protein ENG70_05040 [Candidatus Cloacimonetes bacterium]|nr:hypothetical protein [Candidatus Cloacimonadota bacterium]HEX38203.1 hypothetical protein [Candidatus Cloacimonadota bacterium]
MDFAWLAEKRGAFRSLTKCQITPDLIRDLADTLKLAPSYFNNQPWKNDLFIYHNYYKEIADKE